MSDAVHEAAQPVGHAAPSVDERDAEAPAPASADHPPAFTRAARSGHVAAFTHTAPSRRLDECDALHEAPARPPRTMRQRSRTRLHSAASMSAMRCMRRRARLSCPAPGPQRTTGGRGRRAPPHPADDRRSHSAAVLTRAAPGARLVACCCHTAKCEPSAGDGRVAAVAVARTALCRSRLKSPGTLCVRVVDVTRGRPHAGRDST